MHYHDEIYGDYQITQPVLLDLMNSAAMQRLHGIMQHGITGLIGITSPVTRLDHSVGTMILVARLGGSLAEQVAALLHDVSHTAFSHVIDYVYDNHEGQSFHDEQKELFLVQSDIPAVLDLHNYLWRDFLDDTRFPLLEQPAPRLCADRLDYFFRDSLDLGLAKAQEVHEALLHLTVLKGRIVADSIEAARWLAYTYLAADDASWANLREVGLYELTARAIQRGLEIGTVEDADIWGTDIPLWQKLLQSNDQQLRSNVRLISKNTTFLWDEDRPTFRVSTKLRTIDPDVAIDDDLIPLSRLDQGFLEYRENYLRSKNGKWPIRVIMAS